jgi:flagellar hook assembly protein FlgD
MNKLHTYLRSLLSIVKNNGFFLIAAFVFISSTQSVFAQNQVYIKNVDVFFDDDGVGNHNLCVDVSTTLANVRSSDPEIEFEQPALHTAYPGGCLALCATIYCTNASTISAFGINELRFETFKITAGSNPLDPATTPALRTFFLFNLDSCASDQQDAKVGTYCTPWDGTYYRDGWEAKSNGEFGYRAIVTVQQSNPDIGDITLQHTMAYPATGLQRTITMNVVDIHNVRGVPTLVGNTTAVPARPYNIYYRLSKAADVTLRVYSSTPGVLDRNIVNHSPRPGEGIDDTGLENVDYWDGRNETGEWVSSGTYLYSIDANSYDDAGYDAAYTITGDIFIDPLQITDFKVKNLGATSNDTASLTYMLTEDATVHVEIYQPGTYFTDVSTPNATAYYEGSPTTPVRTFIEQKTMRTEVSTVWDGRDSNGNVLGDGNYVYAIWATMPKGDSAGNSIFTSKTYTGIISINRGYVSVTVPTVSSAVVGSSPPAQNLNPFYFEYVISRESPVTFSIYTSTNGLVKRIVDNEVRPANVVNREYWNGRDQFGRMVSSGTYIAEVSVQDPFVSSKVISKSIIFSANLFRIVDVSDTPLLGGSADQASITYQLSQGMYSEVKIYPKGTVINPDGAWPPVPTDGVGNPIDPIKTFSGTRPGRYKVTEFWDGISTAGEQQSDGNYPYVIVAKSTEPVSIYNVNTSNVTVADPFYPPDKITGMITIARGQVFATDFAVSPTIPELILSSQSVKLPPYSVEFYVTRTASVTISVISSTGGVIKYVDYGSIYEPNVLNRIYWDGTDHDGIYVNPGNYVIRMEVYDYPDTSLQSPTTYQVPVYVNPFQVYDVLISDVTKTSAGVVSYQLSLPMKTAIQIFKPGTTFDVNGNPTPSIAEGSLVKTLVGVRPPLTPIDEYWDGTDFNFNQVPDGNYVFRIVNSTDARLIDSVTGQIQNNNRALISDPVVYDNPNIIVVALGDSQNVCEDFESQALFYPNPLRGTSGKFRITKLPAEGYYLVKVYNVAGDLVYTRNFGNLAPSANYPNFEETWNKVNNAGKTIARGVYFAVFEYRSTSADREVCQKVQKILIP